jgi:hypothetical protein
MAEFEGERTLKPLPGPLQSRGSEEKAFQNSTLRGILEGFFLIIKHLFYTNLE